MKKLLVAVMLVLLLGLFGQNALAADASGGFGLGIPYGVVGGNMQVNLNDNFALSFGLGFTPADVAYAVGARVYLNDSSHPVRPRLGFYYGTVAYEDIVYYNGWYFYEEEKNLDGTALGFGLEFGRVGGVRFDGELIYILSCQDYEVDDLDSQVKISFGVHF